MTYIENAQNEVAKLTNCRGSLLGLYTLLALTTGEKTTAENVHDAWAIDKQRTFPEHRSIVPFDQLSEDVKRLDDRYVHAIREAARAVKEASFR